MKISSTVFLKRNPKRSCGIRKLVGFTNVYLLPLTSQLTDCNMLILIKIRNVKSQLVERGN